MVQGNRGRGPDPLAPGQLLVISLGPGDESLMAPLALQALAEVEVLVGYKTYIGLLPSQLRESKEIVASGMRKEVDRVKSALDLALEGRRVGLICSGDAGVYSLAGLVFEVAEARGIEFDFNPETDAQQLEIKVIPGISALNSAAALLGAPLVHDFMALSLSDHLTPWELIQKRAKAGAEADLVICLYNPRSKSRPDLLARIMELIAQSRRPDTPVGIVTRAYRPGQEVRVVGMRDFDPEPVGMQSLVIIGNSQTVISRGLMVTPRGYGQKYDLS